MGVRGMTVEPPSLSFSPIIYLPIWGLGFWPWLTKALKQMLKVRHKNNPVPIQQVTLASDWLVAWAGPFTWIGITCIIKIGYLIKCLLNAFFRFTQMLKVTHMLKRFAEWKGRKRPATKICKPWKEKQIHLWLTSCHSHRRREAMCVTLLWCVRERVCVSEQILLILACLLNICAGFY